MSNFLQLCLNLPNLGSIGFFVIFVVIVPLLLISTGNVNSLKYYLPLLVMMASVLTEAGKPDIFKDLYPLGHPTNLSGALSKYTINLLALAGILINIVRIGMKYNNLMLATLSGLLSFAIVFPIGGEVIPYFIRRGDERLRELTRAGTKFQFNWHKYVIGIFFVVLFMGIHYLLLKVLLNFFLTQNLQGNIARTNTTKPINATNVTNGNKSSNNGNKNSRLNQQTKF